MSSNCLISFFACCSNRKRAIAPSDSTVYANFLQNVSTQTPVFPSHQIASSESLPSLRHTQPVPHKAIIMIREPTSFQGRSSDEFKRQRYYSNAERLDTQGKGLRRRENVRLDSLPKQIVISKGQGMPKLFPVTPKRGIKASKLTDINNNMIFMDVHKSQED